MTEFTEIMVRFFAITDGLQTYDAGYLSIEGVSSMTSYILRVPAAVAKRCLKGQILPPPGDDPTCDEIDHPLSEKFGMDSQVFPVNQTSGKGIGKSADAKLDRHLIRNLRSDNLPNPLILRLFSRWANLHQGSRMFGNGRDLRYMQE